MRYILSLLTLMLSLAPYVRADDLKIVTPFDKAVFLKSPKVEYEQYIGDGKYIARGDLTGLGIISEVPLDMRVDPKVKNLLQTTFTDRKIFSIILTNSTGNVRTNVECNYAGLSDILARNDVLFVQMAEGFGPDMDIVRIKYGPRWVSNLGNYRGQGVIAEVCDLGIRPTHFDFRSRPPILVDDSVGGFGGFHGTSVYGIVFGDGYVYEPATGILPEGQGVFLWNVLSESDRLKYALDALARKCVFQTNSWGHTQTLEYDTYSFEIDDVLFRTKLLAFQSQSNNGNRNSRPEAWAKNVVSIGGLYHYNNLYDSDDAWDHGASTGPAVDGRVKPDLCAYFDKIYTTDYTDDVNYSDFSGTSAATPIVASLSGLIAQIWSERVKDNLNRFGMAVRGDNPFDSRPLATTFKALLINTAYRYPIEGDINRYNQGWGRPDIRNLWKQAPLMRIIDGTQNVAEHGYKIYPVTINKYTDRLIITLVYSDPPALPYSDKQLINDLDIIVNDPNTDNYMGNYGLLDSNESVKSSVSDINADNINNVENVIISDPQPGSWSVAIYGRSINEDTVPETMVIDSNFSLIITTESCPGDFNRDGVVNALDTSAFLDKFRQHSFECDINNDGVVDIKDATEYYQEYRICSARITTGTLK